MRLYLASRSPRRRELLHQIGIDFDTVSCKVLLVSSVPSESNLDTWEFRADVTNEITGTGYTAGGATATVDTVALNGNFAEVRFEDIEWASASITYRGLLIYNSSKSNKAVAVYDRGSSVTVVSGPIRIRVPGGDLAPVTIT